VAAVSVAALIAWWLGFRGERRRQRDLQMAVKGDMAFAATPPATTAGSPAAS